MKRHISIFALLLSAFAAVGQDVDFYYVAANVSCTITRNWIDGDYNEKNEQLAFGINASDYYYYQNNLNGDSFAQFFPTTRTLTADSVTGCRFLGWYSKLGGWSVGLRDVTAESAEDLITENTALAADSVERAGKAGMKQVPIVFAKYVKVWTVTTGVNPAGAGTVSISGTNVLGTVDDGGSVTLTAMANKGYDFSKWSDGNTTNQRTISGISSNATYTAVFTKKANAITSGPTIENWTYGDTAKAPSAQAKYTGSTGMTYTYYNSSKTSLGSQPPTNAGTYYIRATSPSSDEYVSATSGYVQFSISKKTINTDNVSFSNKNVIYTGGAQTVTASNVPSGVKVTYENDTRTAVGEQTATAKFAATDSANCQVTTTSKTAKLTITAATITGVALKSTSVTYDGQPHQPIVASVTANGKTFTDAAIGWDVTYDKTDFTNVGNITVTANGKKNLTGSANATFEIKSKSITVTFNANGGNAPSQASKTVQYPGTYGTLATCTRKGYDFTGWWTAKEGGTQITEMTTVDLTANQTLFAHWEAKHYKLTVDANGGEYEGHKGSWDLQEPLIYGETNLNQIAVAIKNDDSPLLGYKIGSTMVFDSQGRCVKGALGEYWTADYPDGTYCHDGHLVVTAEWDDPREHYQVIVTASPEEAGTVSPAGTNTFVEGSNVVLTATENTGYSFCCWSNDNKVVSTATNYQLTVTANAEYTAVFTGNVYKVTFITNGGTPLMPDAYEQVGTDWVWPQVSYSGHELEGWYVLGTDERIEFDAAVKPEPPQFVYAKWNEITKFTVTFADPEGKNKAKSELRAKGQPIGIAHEETKSWKRDGYWRDNSSDWDPPLTTLVTSNMTVNAKWTSIADVLDCTNLTFNVSAGLNWKVCTSEHVVGDSCMQLESNTGSDHLSVHIPEAGTLSFNWRVSTGTLSVSTNKDSFVRVLNGPAEKWNAGEKEIIEISGPCDLTFYGHSIASTECLVDNVSWVPETIPQRRKVSVSAGEHGTAAKSPVKDEYDVDDTVTLTATADTGYAFCCWTNDTGFATDENPWTFTVVDDVAYTATFTNCQYVVTLNQNGGTGGAASVLVTYDRDLPSLGNLPYKDGGSSFLGYFDQETNGTQYYSNGGTGLRKWDKPNAATLYAQWKALDMFTLTVTDDGHGTATKEPNQSQYVFGTRVTLTATANEGFAFEKWSDGSIEIVREVTVMSNASYAASFTNIPVVVIDPIARALDCEDSGLTFEMAGDWSVITNGSFAKKGDSYLSDLPDEAKLKTTISQSGTLTFWWKAPTADYSSVIIEVETNGQHAISCKFKDTKEEWKSETLYIDASQGEVELTFESGYSGDDEDYRALDFFTWTPDGEEYALEVTSAGHGTVAKNPSRAKYEEGTPVTILATPDDGYAFEKWSDGSAVNPLKITVVSNASYSASFTNCRYVVTFDAADGTASMDEKAVKYGEAYGDLPTAEKYGSVFAGWFLGETEIKSETVVTTAYDHTLVAKWRQDAGKYTIRFKVPDGLVKPSDMNCVTGAVYRLPDLDPAYKWRRTDAGGRLYDGGMLVFDLIEAAALELEAVRFP